MTTEEDGGNGLEFLTDPVDRFPLPDLASSDFTPPSNRNSIIPGSASDSSMGDVGDAPLSIQLVANAGGDAPTLSTTDLQLSTGKDDPQTASWAKRVRVGRARVERLPCAGRVCALEKTLRCYAEKKTDTVVVPAIGYTFDSLGEAYDFYNLYSWEIGFGISESANHMLKGYVPASCPMHLFVRQYMRLLFDREANENYEERRTKISLPVMKVNTPLEFHASKIYTRAMFEKFGEVLYEAGQYKVEEIEKNSKYYVHRYHPERHDKWCRVVYTVEVVEKGQELICELLGIDKIPLKHILKRWTKGARDILPDHLVHLQKDKISVNSITFRHSNLYTHALEVVKLGDANPIAYDCAMELLRGAMDKLTPLAVEHDGLGLEHRIEFDKSKDTELSLLQGPKNGCDSDDEGSVVGNFIGLSAPERKRKAGRSTNSRDKPLVDGPCSSADEVAIDGDIEVQSRLVMLEEVGDYNPDNPFSGNEEVTNGGEVGSYSKSVNDFVSFQYETDGVDCRCTGPTVPDEVLPCVLDPSKIHTYNWGQYLLDVVMIFFVEWMDFKEHNSMDNSWPLISAYTSDKLKELFALARKATTRFKDAAIYTKKEDGLQGVYSMFSKDTLEYSLEQSKKIMVILDVAKACCVYEIDITSRSLLVMDPTLTSSPPGSLEDNTESGFYVLHYVKEYDGTMLRISPTTGLITYMKMQMAHEILHMPGNKAHLEEKMYGRIQD
ncbi:hypothetical protein D1007_11150 [Hordeum vulgare]|nr:hypothetical protein D1007_11150 [Hordeum vulgare]